MTEPEDRDELRRRLRRVEEDAAAARYLAGSADRDTAELRTEVREFRAQNTRLLNAMREDITDLRTGLTDFRGQVQQEFARVDKNFLTVHSKIDGVAAGLQVLTDLLTRRERNDPPPA